MRSYLLICMLSSSWATTVREDEGGCHEPAHCRQPDGLAQSSSRRLLETGSGSAKGPCRPEREAGWELGNHVGLSAEENCSELVPAGSRWATSGIRTPATEYNYATQLHMLADDDSAEQGARGCGSPVGEAVLEKLPSALVTRQVSYSL